MKPDGKPFEPEPLQLLEPDADGRTDVGPLNAGFGKTYLADPRNPRWIAKPTVAYLWARTVRCKGCRATLPLLKTKWLAKKDNKRVLLTVTPTADRTGVVFGIETDVPQVGGNAAQRREHDKRHGAGTMSRSGAQCPCCPTIMRMDDIRYEGRAGRLGAVMTAVVVDGVKGKEYRLPTEEELRAAEVSKEELDELYEQIPFGLPEEPTPRQGPGAARAFSVDNYGFDQWAKLFTDRQLMTLGSFVGIVRSLAVQNGKSREIVGNRGKSKNAEIWREAVVASLAYRALDRAAYRGSQITTWQNDPEKLRNTFCPLCIADYLGLCRGKSVRRFLWRFCTSYGMDWRGCSIHTSAAARVTPEPTVVNVTRQWRVKETASTLLSPTRLITMPSHTLI